MIIVEPAFIRVPIAAGGRNNSIVTAVYKDIALSIVWGQA